MKIWIYFATENKASLASTLETVINQQFLWRSAFKKNGALIPNIGSIKEGDSIVVAWRHSGIVRTAYLRCKVAAPFSPLASGLVIDKVAGPDAAVLCSVGYPTNLAGAVEGLRLSEILECCFQVKGEYGGNNAIHGLAPEDVAQLPIASMIPPEAFIKLAKGILNRALRPESVAPVTGLIATEADQVEIKAMTEHRAFDAYVMVDWSSSSSPVTGNDSIWIASGAWSGRVLPPDLRRTSRRGCRQ